jgi:hypothetical protein
MEKEIFREGLGMELKNLILWLTRWGVKSLQFFNEYFSEFFYKKSHLGVSNPLNRNIVKFYHVEFTLIIILFIPFL